MPAIWRDDNNCYRCPELECEYRSDNQHNVRVHVSRRHNFDSPLRQWVPSDACQDVVLQRKRAASRASTEKWRNHKRSRHDLNSQASVNGMELAWTPEHTDGRASRSTAPRPYTRLLQSAESCRVSKANWRASRERKERALRAFRKHPCQPGYRLPNYSPGQVRLDKAHTVYIQCTIADVWLQGFHRSSTSNSRTRTIWYALERYLGHPIQDSTDEFSEAYGRNALCKIYGYWGPALGPLVWDSAFCRYELPENIKSLRSCLEQPTGQCWRMSWSQDLGQEERKDFCDFRQRFLKGSPWQLTWSLYPVQADPCAQLNTQVCDCQSHAVWFIASI